MLGLLIGETQRTILLGLPAHDVSENTAAKWDKATAGM